MTAGGLPGRVSRRCRLIGIATDTCRDRAGGPQLVRPLRRASAKDGLCDMEGLRSATARRVRPAPGAAPVLLAARGLLGMPRHRERTHCSRQLRNIGDNGRKPILGRGGNSPTDRWVGFRLAGNHHSADRRRSRRWIERRSPGRLARRRNTRIGTRHGRRAPISDDKWKALARAATDSGVPSGSPSSRRKTSCADVRRRS
jgi:hypothetical protein